MEGGLRSALYNHDSKLQVRKSHENLDIKKIYNEFLDEPIGYKSYHLLHTKYMWRKEIK